MAIPEATVDQVLAKCARHCCICRRFKPLHLHVHHIRERSEGGTDDFDNLIATCMTCHSDIHTATKLTRRFTESELKLHRNAVYELVASGRLPAGPEVTDAIDSLVPAVIRLAAGAAAPSPTKPTLSAEAAEMLVGAAAEGDIFRIPDLRVIQLRGKSFTGNDPRTYARYSRGFDDLLQFGLIEHVNLARHQVTDDGYRLADELLAAASLQVDEKQQ